MELAMNGLHNKNFIGYNSIDDFQRQKLKLFSIEFQADFTSGQIQDVIKKLSVLIQYNQSYVDMPHFYSIYGDEKFAKAQPYDLNFSYASWSSFPLAIQTHVLKAIMKLHSIDYDPIYRANVVQARNLPNQQQQALSTVLFGLIFALQSIFVVIQIQQDKQGQLDSIRLSGVTDIIYISELFCFQMSCYLLMAFFQFYTAFWLPGGNDVFFNMSKTQFIFIVFIGGIYSTCFGIFVGVLTKPKASVLILMFASYIIISLCFQMFGTTMLYDASILSSFGLFVIRWVFPYSTLMQTTSFVIYQNIAIVKFDDKTFSYINKNTNFTFTNFSSSIHNKTGAFNSKITYTLPSCMYILSLTIYQSILLILFAWILGEQLSGNASASRPFWKLFKRHQQTSGFTHGQLIEKNINIFKANIQNKIRQKLTEEQVTGAID
ncbi:ABC_transporter family protein [Hexamita inflata]|uniref:ABC_transporter family protein n=1 Tax=Hexamita inflata TaxID=28002 RepID=A0ABP1I7D6_9EUKA